MKQFKMIRKQGMFFVYILVSLYAYVCYFIELVKDYEVTVCMTDACEWGSSNGTFAMVVVFAGILLFYNELIESDMSIQYVIRSGDKTCVYIKQLVKIVCMAVVWTFFCMAGLIIVALALNMPICNWNETNSFLFVINRCRVEHNGIVIIFQLSAYMVLQAIYFMLVVLILRWLTSKKNIVIGITSIIYVAELSDLGILSKLMNVSVAYENGVFEPVYLIRISGVLMLAVVLGLALCWKKEFYYEK